MIRRLALAASTIAAEAYVALIFWAARHADTTITAWANRTGDET